MNLRIFVPLVFTILLLPGIGLAGAKTDVLVLSNGDRVTGEIINLEAGILEFNTDTMGRVYVEWRFIRDVISDKQLSLETTDGLRWLGNLQTSSDDEKIVIETVRGPLALSTNEVVSAWPVEATFLDKVKLDLALGFDYTKSTDITNINASVDFAHRTGDRETEASLRTDITAQGEGAEQNRHVINLSHQYNLPERRFRSYFGSFEANDAIGLDARLAGGVAFGRYLIKTNNKWFSIQGGVQATEENPTDGDSQTSLEAVGNVRYRFFKYATPERNLDVNFSLYPSLSDWGRIRADLRTSWKHEITKDLFYTFEIYATKDSEPLSEDAEDKDYGVISSLGWSY